MSKYYLFLVTFLVCNCCRLSAQDDNIIFDSVYNDFSTDTSYQESHFLTLDGLSTADSIINRRVPANVTAAMQADEAFWYASGAKKEPETEKDKNSAPRILQLISQPWFRILVWVIIIGGFASVLIWYIIESRISIFQKKAGTIGQGENDLQPENIFDIDYENAIKQATGDADYRLATRLLFLRLLKLLDQAEIIQYTHDRTNMDYLRQAGQSAYYKDFFLLTRNYEYAWYGHFDMSADHFRLLQKEFGNLEAKLHRY